MKHSKADYDWSLALMRFLATLFVMNSHMSICYPPEYQSLATGGGIGNTLFFFISGFALFFGREQSFPNFYKRKIARIYPAVICVAILKCLIQSSPTVFLQWMVHYWFINCIIVYYAILWICRRYNLNLPTVIIGSLILTLSLFLLFYDFSKQGLFYSDHLFRYFIYFTFMAQGAYIGKRRDNYKPKRWHYPLVFTCFFAWYVIVLLTPNNPLQLLSLMPLFGFCYSLYVIGKAPFITKIIKGKIIRPVIIFCGNLCLEVYLIQYFIFSAVLNFIFPLNIPIIMAIVILGAYVLHISANLFGQIFDSQPFSMNKLLQV